MIRLPLFPLCSIFPRVRVTLTFLSRLLARSVSCLLPPSLPPSLLSSLAGGGGGGFSRQSGGGGTGQAGNGNQDRSGGEGPLGVGSKVRGSGLARAGRRRPAAGYSPTRALPIPTQELVGGLRRRPGLPSSEHWRERLRVGRGIWRGASESPDLARAIALEV